MKPYPFIFFLFLFVGCIKNKHKPLLDFDSIKDSSKGIVYLKDSILLITDTTYQNSSCGGYYEFYPNKMLKNYYFFTKEDNEKNLSQRAELIQDNNSNKNSYYSYAELYDSTGTQTKLYGNPLVYKHSLLKLKDSTITLKLYFFTLNKNYGNINIDINGKKYIDLALNKDTSFSNMSSIKLITKYDFKNGYKLYINTNYIDYTLGDKQIRLIDSCYFKY